ncbi:MAG: hypothetical protein ACK41Z_14270 [Sediminibacterium sp.]
MKPLIVLISVFLVSIFIIKLLTQKYDLQLSAKIGMSAMLVFTAMGHFAYTKGMAMMIPPVIPLKTEIVYLTGFLEIFLGICLLIPRLSVYAGWVLIIFFILLLPANIYASIKQIDYQKASFDGNGLMYLWFRMPLQILFIAWTYLSAIKAVQINS